MVSAAVQRAAQELFAFYIRSILLAGGDKGHDALFQLGVLVHGQAALADKGAALKYAAGHTGEQLAGVLAGHALHLVGGAGVGCVKAAHGSAALDGVAHQNQIVLAVVHIDAALHGGSAPGSVPVFVGQRAPLAARQAVKHGPQKGEPGGFAGFVGGLDHIQPLLEIQGGIVEAAERGCERL